MQIINPLRAALPYITLQTAKVQRCWADYFIFRGFAGGRRPFRLRRNTQAKPASAAGGGRACGRPSPPVCGTAGSLRSPPLTAPHLCSIIKTEPRYLCKMQYFVDDTDTRPSERNGRSYRYNYQNLTQQEEQ